MDFAELTLSCFHKCRDTLRKVTTSLEHERNAQPTSRFKRRYIDEVKQQQQRYHHHHHHHHQQQQQQ